MKIAYVTADRGIPVFGDKGASVHVREMANAFADVGHEVTVFAARRGGPATPMNARIIEGANDANLAVEPDTYGDVLAKRRLKEQRSLAVSDRIQERVVWLHGEREFDLIYERYSLFSTAGVRAANRIGVPCVVEVNSPLLKEQQAFRKLVHEGEAKAVEVEIFSRAQALLAVSAEVRDYTLANGAPVGRAHVVANGVDTTRFRPDVAAELVEGLGGKFVIGFAGSLKPWHGIEVLMDTYRALAKKRDDYHLLIVGDGPLCEWLSGYVNGAGLQDRVTMTGWVPHRRLPGLLRTMDVAVAPYPPMDEFYFSPLKLYEYLAAGVPVVASRVGQIAEVLNDGVTGLLTVPGDTRDLVHRIEALRVDAPLRASLAEEGARSVAGHTWEDNARRIIEIAEPMLSAA